MPEAHVEVIKSERGSEGRRAGGSGGRRAARAAPAASDAPGNPGHPARRKLFAITDFLPAPGPRTGGTHIPPPVGRGSGGAGWLWDQGASVPPATGRKRRCSLAWLEMARDSHYFEKLHLGWEKKGILADTELSLGCPCVQGEIPEC